MAFGDMMDMMKKAKELQGKMEQLQAEVSAMEISGSSGGGLVTVMMTGKSEMRRVTIDPSLLKPEEAEIVEDLIVAAVNDARVKAEAALADKMRDLTGGLQLPPGAKLPF
jgi:DNA-binding YbaB/EbfC family protein